MTSAEIRRAFLDYFAARGHTIVPSSSLIPDDPTLLLTAAGMVQFKPVFLGKRKADYKRAASSQKCLRTTDIERVGHTARHLTFFEMLGNFSFGDYYKREASAWAWEFLTAKLGLSVDKLWVTIFETDEEAHDIWTKEVGVDPGRVVRLGEKDNFWAAGPTGPCGPCSEIHYDFGPEKSCGSAECRPGCDCDRYLEVWNLVFMQYNRDDTGELHPLPKRNIDTGMGLERIASILQGVDNNFETDLLLPLINQTAKISCVKLGDGAESDISLKVVADHMRAVTFMISDGISPSNEGRGYVTRRLLRRAVRHGRLLGIREPFAARLAQTAIDTMGPVYDELSRASDNIMKVVAAEEERFDHTLRQGLAVIEAVVAEARTRPAKGISAEAAFKLYDTYGFPLELTEEIAAESGLDIDKAGFDKLMDEQKERARKGAVSGHAEIFVKNIYPQIKEQCGETEFAGYEEEELEAHVVAIVTGDASVAVAISGQQAEVFLDKTPFYAEMGGQVGDTGVIATDTGKARVLDTVGALAGLYAHKVEIFEGELHVGDSAMCQVDHRRRIAIARNHTGTHLLHWALRAVLGEQATQAGSLVDADRLRFDFHNPKALTAAEIAKVELMVNEKVWQDHPVRVFTTSLEYAREIGAVALFGEKYGKFVRLVEIGNFSRELCGGVHLHTTSQLGFLKIISEGSVGAGLRRIEALTGERLWNLVQEEEGILDSLREVTSTTRVKDLPAVVGTLRARAAAAETDLRSRRAVFLAETAEKLQKLSKQINGFEAVIAEVEASDIAELKALADKLITKSPSSVVILASRSADKALLLAAAGTEAVSAGFNCGAVVKKLAAVIGGGGGGRLELAQAGGSLPEKVPELLVAAERMLQALPVSK